MTKVSAYKTECKLLRLGKSILKEHDQEHLFGQFTERILRTPENKQNEIMNELSAVQLKVILQYVKK